MGGGRRLWSGRLGGQKFEGRFWAIGFFRVVLHYGRSRPRALTLKLPFPGINFFKIQAFRKGVLPLKNEGL